MQRIFTKDVGRFKRGTVSGDWPITTWRQLERNAKQPMDKFSKPAEVGNTVPLAGAGG